MRKLEGGIGIGIACLIALVLSVCGDCVAQDSAAKLLLLPPSISLSTKESRQTLVPQWKRGEQVLGQATEGVQLTSSDEKVVKIENSVAVPVGNGTATITAKVGEQTATAEVTVTGQDQP